MSKYSREKMLATINFLNSFENFLEKRSAIVIKAEEMDDDNIADVLREAIKFFGGEDENGKEVLGEDGVSYSHAQCPHCLEVVPVPEDSSLCVFCNKDITVKPEPVSTAKVEEEVQKNHVETMGDLDDTPKLPETKKRRRRTKEEIIEDQRKLAAAQLEDRAKEKEAKRVAEEQKDIPELVKEKEVATKPIGVSDEKAREILNSSVKTEVKEVINETPRDKTLELPDNMQVIVTVGYLKKLLNAK